MHEYKTVSVPLNKLIPFEGRTIKPYSGAFVDVAIKAESIDSFGREIPIYVRATKDDVYEVLTGYTRVGAAQNMQLSEISVVVVSGLSDDYAQRLVASGSIFAGGNMDIGEARKHMYIQTELSRKGAYHIDVHMLHVNDANDDLLQKKIIHIHEALHAMVGELLIGFLIGDFFLLTEHLLRFSDSMRGKLFTTYFNKLGISDPVEQNLYACEKSNELSALLSQNDDYMKLVHHCLRAFFTYKYLHENLRALTEGLATFLSFKFVERAAEEIDNMYLRNAVLSEKAKFLDEYNDESSAVGFYIAKKIFDKYGFDGLAVSALSATAIPYYNFDLISCSDEEWVTLLYSFYNCDKRWLKFLSLDGKDIDKILANISDNPQISLEKLGCKLSNVESYPARPNEYAHTAKYTVNHLLLHPRLLNDLSNLGFDISEVEEVSKKSEYKSEMPLSEINTYERLILLFRQILEEVDGAKSENFVEQDPIASLEKKYKVELRINTLRHVSWYHRMIDDDTIKKMLLSDALLSDEDTATIRKYAEQYKRN